MSKKPSTRSLIITLYGDYIRHFGNEIWIGSLIELLEAFGHNEQSVRTAVSRMSRQNWLTSRKEGNKSYYSLTEYGKKRTNEAAVRIYQIEPEKWDGKWRILFYTIPEDKRKIRDQLRNELVWSGFAPLTNGAWITPNNLEEQVQTIIQKYQIEEYVNFFVSENLGPKSNKEIILQYWDIEKINETYEQFIQMFENHYKTDQRKMKQGKLDEEECFVKRTMLVHEYRKSLFVDPGLPEELLPGEWKRNEAASLFHQYYSLLETNANHFFVKIFAKGYEQPVRK